MAAAPTIDAVWAKRISAKLKVAGLPAGEILRKAGIKPHLLNQRNARIPFRQHAALLELASIVTENSCFGLELAAREIDPRDAGLLAYAALSSRTLGDAVKIIKRYLRVLNEAAEIRTAIQRDLAVGEFYFTDASVRTCTQATEFGLANFVRSMRFLTGIQLRPMEVGFAHPRNRDINKFEKFFGCPIRFGGRRNSIIISRHQLALPIATADERLLGILTGYCDEILASRAKISADLRHEVERLIMKLLSRGEADTRRVAHELGMSVRTLARKLRESGASFAEILDELRADLARKYLGDVTLTVSQVTFLLGYSEVSAFNHAFKRWTGKTPSRWRAVARA
jgi:AraC-like DNA-binding protein